jgi:hypothetical protein
MHACRSRSVSEMNRIKKLATSLHCAGMAGGGRVASILRAPEHGWAWPHAARTYVRTYCSILR